MARTKKPKPPTTTEIAEDLAYVLNDLLAYLPPLDYAAAPVALIEAVHAAQNALRANAALLAY